ncbi:MAG: hypothetical protein CVU22_03270 [Betaproteobacteria bacterium HGW-Betaproteobacteria-16]|nr:MAG: hypothetical protein CVU22_03270 [Betaproteobacteria bacterium HGW-Betaproteobacteria-16]
MSTLIEPWREGTQHAWASLARGWSELRQHVDGVLARFIPSKSADRHGGAGEGLVAADLCVEEDRIIVSMELPGTLQEELEIDIDGDQLTVSGEWRVEQESGDGTYRIVRCAYRRFRRKLTLPHQIDPHGSHINYHNGVLRISMPRADRGPDVVT